MTAVAIIAIAVKYITPVLKANIKQCLRLYSQTGGNIIMEETKWGRWPHLLFYVQDEKKINSGIMFRNLLAQSLAQYIVAEQADLLFAEMMKQSYFYFPQEEREHILILAQKNYLADPAKDIGGQVYAEILQQLQEYLEQHDYVNLHGLMLFRMQGWLKFVRRTLDRAVDDYLMEKEYQEFIKLLKYFVALQEPKLKQVHVLLNESGCFYFLDHTFQPVEQQQEIIWDGDHCSCEEEDQLVSLIISLAPHHIILHHHVYLKYPKAVDTLKHVFEQRVSICKGCKLCHNAKNKIFYKRKT